MCDGSGSSHPKLLVSAMFPNREYKPYASKNKKIGSDPGTSFEVFRNNTTAVEIIVKELPKKDKKRPDDNQTLLLREQRLLEVIEKLKIELNKANGKFGKTKESYSALIYELKRQLDLANQRETELLSKTLSLELENDKLSILLESKSSMVEKLKRELNNMKRLLKFVIKGIWTTPFWPLSCTQQSDQDYEDFEKGLKKEPFKFANYLDGTGVTFDSTMSKDMSSL